MAVDCARVAEQAPMPMTEDVMDISVANTATDCAKDEPTKKPMTNKVRDLPMAKHAIDSAQVPWKSEPSKP